MGKKKQRVSKPMTAMERERLRIQTDLIGQENQHLVNTRDSGNVRQLRGRNVPIPTPPNLSDKSGSDSAGSFDLGIENKPPPPVEPPPLPPTSPPRKRQLTWKKGYPRQDK